MRSRPPVPRPWWQVGLAVLPGLIFLLGEVAPPSALDTEGVRSLALAVWALVSVASIVRAVVRRSPFAVAVWGLIPLGWLAGMGAMWAIDPFRMAPACALLAVAGLLFARENGVSGGLFVLAGGMLAASWTIWPSMYFWDSPFWSTFTSAGMTLLFTLLAPIWVLRSRSALGQALGLLFPVAAYGAAFVLALSSACGIPPSRGIFTAAPFLVLFGTIAVAGAVYAWIAARGFAAGVGEAPPPGRG